ncbi:hypothetical protein PTKIN_Ptkin01aG0140200 [Pterospermum kingtungense]
MMHTVASNNVFEFACRIEGKGKGILQDHQIILEFEAIPEKSRKGKKPEAIVLPLWVALAVRPRPSVWEYIRVNVHDLVFEELTVAEYIHFKEELVDERLLEKNTNGNFVLELDFEPFNASFHRPTLSKLFHDKGKVYGT